MIGAFFLLDKVSSATKINLKKIILKSIHSLLCLESKIIFRIRHSHEFYL